MGEVSNFKQRARAAGRLVLPVLAGLLVACSSSAPSRVAGGSASEPAPPDTAVAAAPAAPAAAIRAVELREDAPGMALVVRADRPLVWTNYRDAEGRLVLELPNSAATNEVASLAPTSGLVAAVEVSNETGADRPLTRLVVATRGDAEHTLSAVGEELVLRLVPVGASETAGAPAVAFEPLPESPAESRVATLPPPPVALGSADAPAPGTPPVGVPADRLDAVTVRMDGPRAEVLIEGNGQFAYSTFVLDEPTRFVVDLAGVINASGRSVIPTGGSQLERVRVAQFRTAPDAVARVVVDLADGTMPAIAVTERGLALRFGPQLDSVAAAPTPAEARPTTLAEDLEAAGPAVESEPEAMAQADSQPLAPPVESAPPAPASAVVEAPPATPPAPEPAPSYAELPTAPAPAPTPPPAPVVRPTREVVERVEAAAPAGPSAAATEEQRQATLATFKERVAGSGTAREYVGEPISMELKDADIRDVLRTFAKISGLNIIVQPGVRGSVTVLLENVPWDQALEQILKINNLGMELDGNILRIATNQRLQQEAREAEELKRAQALSVPLETIIKRVSYARAGALAGVVRSVMSQRGSITIDARTNTLIIKELPGFLKTVIAVIETLDTPEPQVMIEARIVETTKRFSRSLGIRWGFDGVADAAHGNTTGLIFPNTVSGDGAVNLLTGGQNGLLNLTLGNILDTFTLDATLQVAESEGLINILSAPKVSVLNNESASIQSGLQIPIQTVANNTVSVQFVNATLRLEVTPQVTAEGTVMLEINVQKRNPELAFAVAGATNAPINTREARTRVIVRDGGTTVIGGIYEVSNDFGEDRVPGLANVPILKYLFKNKRSNQENKELLIFITPRVVKL